MKTIVESLQHVICLTFLTLSVRALCVHGAYLEAIMRVPNPHTRSEHTDLGGGIKNISPALTIPRRPKILLWALRVWFYMVFLLAFYFGDVFNSGRYNRSS